MRTSPASWWSCSRWVSATTTSGTSGRPRALKLPSDGSGVVERVIRMGQAVYNPPDVAGWPGGRAWLNSGTWIERLNFANAIAAVRGDNRMLPIPIDRYLQDHGLRRA